MRTTATIEDDLYKKALDRADPDRDQSERFHEAIKTFVRIQAAKRLAALGRISPEREESPRRQTLTSP